MFSQVGQFEGAAIAFLAKAKSGVFPFVPQLTTGNKEPAFAGDSEAYLKDQEGKNTGLTTEQLQRLLLNTVKKCPTCAKPNAFTLPTCNQCGTSLVDVPTGHSNNCFTGFVLGIQKGPFPFTVSLRYQDEKVLVIDDLLALAPLHFNVIPTCDHIPDWRYLLRQPKEGLELVCYMMGKLAEATQPFFQDAAWCKKFVRVSPSQLDVNDIMAGFNYPPSQYQLHIQYIFPALLPFQYAQYLKGVHYTHKRFFPVSYVLQCLKLASKHPLPSNLLEDKTSIDDIVEYFRVTHHHDYDASHMHYYKNFRNLQLQYSQWEATDFEGMAVDINGKYQYFQTEAGKEPVLDSSVDVDKLVAQDKMALQGYGRPYTAEGKPTGSYYAFPKKPQELRQW